MLIGYSAALHMIYRAARTPERAIVESPRTSWSSKRTGQIGRWYDWQQQLATEATNFQPSSPYDARARLVLLGDSITEAWRGSSYGEARPDRSVPQVLHETLAKRWPDPLVLGISGDQTQHLLYRLSHGEISKTMAMDPRLLVVLLIGTNNLAAGHAPEEVAEGIEAVAGRVLNLTRGRLLINALFPRGDGMRSLPAICPPRCAKSGKPLRTWRPSIDRVNYLLNRSVQDRLQQLYSVGRVRFVDCGRFLVGRSGPMTDMSGGGRSGPGEASGERAANQISGVVAGQNGREISRAFEAAVIGVHDVVGGATRGANELIAGATRGVNDVISKGNEFLGRGGSTMTAEEHEHLSSDCFGPDKLHPNAEGHRRWAGCLEAAMGEWGVARR